MRLFNLVLVPLISSLIIYILPVDKKIRNYLTIFVQVIIMGLVGYELFFVEGVYVESMSLHSIDIGVKLRWDYMSSIMVSLSSILFFTSSIYGFDKKHSDRLFVFLFLALEGIINGIFLSADFFNIYLLVEAASIVVAVLIMYKKDATSIYDGMLYLMVNLTAMVFFLFGVGYMYKIFGSFDLMYIASKIPLIEDKSILAMPFSFLLTGVSLKSALMPLFSWLPKAHASPSAPAPVSAILSGIFVKTGVYMLIRLYTIFGVAFNLADFFFELGLITAILGAVFAFSQTDIKLMLSYHTVSQVGLIVTAISMQNEYSNQGAYYHIFTHGVFKVLLILTASVLVNVYKTRNMKKMKGLWHYSKTLSIFIIIGIISITGAPLTSGGFSKGLIAKAFHGGTLEIVYVVISMVTMISFSKFIGILFAREFNGYSYKTSNNEYISLHILAVLSIVVGVFGRELLQLFTASGAGYDYHIDLVHVLKYVVEFCASYLLYKFLIKREKMLKYIKSIELTFNQVVLSMIAFFMLVMVYYNF